MTPLIHPPRGEADSSSSLPPIPEARPGRVLTSDGTSWDPHETQGRHPDRVEAEERLACILWAAGAVLVVILGIAALIGQGVL